MATGVTLYKSTDTSAPAINSSLGSLVTALDAILVNGYGSKPAAGWAKSFSGTNSAVYRPAGGNRFYLNVDDNGPGAGLGKEARMRGYEVSTAVSTGTGLFPTAAQLAAGIICRKSAEASGGTTARVWAAVADDRTLYLFINPGDSAGYTGFLFGDFFSDVVSDGYRTMIVGRHTENSALGTSENADRLSTASIGVVTGHYVARSYSQLGTSVAIGKYGSGAPAASTTYLTGTYGFPNASDGSFRASPVNLTQGASASYAGIHRGRLRGFLHGVMGQFPVAFADGDTLASITGKSYIIIGRTYQGADGYFLLETSDTWETNV